MTTTRDLYDVELCNPDTGETTPGQRVEVWHVDRVQAERYGRHHRWTPLDKVNAQEWITLWVMAALYRLGRLPAPDGWLAVDFDGFLAGVVVLEPVGAGGAVDPTDPPISSLSP